MVDFELNPLTDAGALLSDWRSLFERASIQNFFLSPAWMEAWLSGAPEGARLFRLEGKVNGRQLLLGVVADASQHPPLLGLRETWFQEFGDRARDAIYIEYNDFLIANMAPDDIRERAIEFLIDQHVSRDAFIFRNLTNDMAKAVRAGSMAAGCSIRVLQEQPVYACGLGGSAFMEGLSNSLQSKVKRAMRLYEERGPLSGRVVAAGEASFDAVWNKMTSLHAQRWRGMKNRSAFENPYLVAFHNRLMKAARGNIHLFEVTAGSGTIAVLYNFVHAKRVMNYQGGFLFEDDNRLTPGFVAHALAAEHYRQSGYAVYDLLAGDADYKSRLGEQETTLTSLVAERKGWRNTMRKVLRR